jgi:predicted RNase H-like nuclease
MGPYVGVDWASNGWLGVVLDGDDHEFDLYPSLLSLWKYHSDAERILIDVPIGLPADGKRDCDVEAKSHLQARQGSVFYTPVRKAVYATDIETAKEHNEPAGYSVQNQVWGIVPRIREADEFLDCYPGARDRIRETHPEICFHALKGGPLKHSKHTEAGIEERTELLAEEDPYATDLVAEAVEKLTQPSYAPTVGRVDDIIDALVAALTARRDERDLAVLPDSDPPRDARGLPMEIVYPSPARQTTLDDV